MENSVTKKELKKNSRNFRMFASRAMHSSFGQMNRDIKKLIEFVDNTPLIINYIQSIPDYDFGSSGDVATEVATVQKASFEDSVIFSIGDNTNEEVSATYQILKYVSGNTNVEFFELGKGYTPSNKYQDWADEFGDNIIEAFVLDIDMYLEGISIDMGYDEDARMNVTVNGGQANVSFGKDSKINAVQNNSSDSQQLESLIGELKKALQSKQVPEEVRNGIEAQTDILHQEVKQTVLNKSRINGVVSTLKALGTTVVGVASVTGSIQNIIDFANGIVGGL